MCILGLLAAGCPGGDDGGGGVTAVELGTGTINWEPITDGQDLELIAGPQGGHHFILHSRARGILPGDPERPGLDENPATLFQIFADDDRQVDAQFPPYKLGYRAAGGGWFVLPSGRILQLIEGEVESLFDTEVRIVIRVRDEAGREATDEHRVHVIRELGAADAGAGDDAGTPDAAP